MTDRLQLKNVIKIEGKEFTLETLRHHIDVIDKDIAVFWQELYDFISQWWDDSPTLTVQTSGSTGTPKVIVVQKKQMAASASMTCQCLQIKSDDTALLCMPLQYIAGKMMVVRAIVCKLNLIPIKPSGHPLKEVNFPINFAAMIPMQVHNSLLNEEEKARLHKIEHLIIGGGVIDKEMEYQLQDFDNAIYSTYGMTETLSHIALRRLNGIDASKAYRPLPGVSLTLSLDNTLIIDAPHVCDTVLQTNDIAEIYDDGSFIIKGRKDNIINSGGVKIQIEMVEDELKPFLSIPFAITSVPDGKLGEKVVLLLADDIDLDLNTAFEKMSKYNKPKLTLHVKEIPLTPTGKIDRAAVREMAIALV